MKIITNESLIKRNAKIGQFAMLAGLAVLLGGMYISFKIPEKFSWSIGALMIGFLLSQVGIYYSNRWGRRPRPDEMLDASLKGLDNKFSIYHYTTPTQHLLVGPAGIWVLIPKHISGTITYSNGRYKQKGGNLYLKIFAQESLGKPEYEITSEKSKIYDLLSEHLPEDKIPTIKSALIFTNPKADIQVEQDDDPPAVTIPIGKLKDVIRKEAKGKHLSMERAEEINEILNR